MNKTLYERKKGKEMQASGEWAISDAEQRVVNVVSILFFISVVAIFVTAMLPISRIFLGVSIAFAAVMFLTVFATLFLIVFRKNKEVPMDQHYYQVDETYNGITGEAREATKEITKEEFYQQKKK